MWICIKKTDISFQLFHRNHFVFIKKKLFLQRIWYQSNIILVCRATLNEFNFKKTRKKPHILKSQGAHEFVTPSLALLSIVSGSGSECRTMAPYNPYSAIMLLRPHVFSVFRHFARRFWNQTFNEKNQTQCVNSD